MGYPDLQEIAAELSRFARFSIALLVLPACASFGRPTFERPNIELQRITLTEVNASGAELTLLLAVDNPNVFTIYGRSLEVTLDLEDVRFGELTHRESFSLAGRDTTEVEIPVRFTWAAVGTAARALLTAGEVAYAIEGGVDLETPYGSGRVPYRQSGRLPLFNGTTSAATVGERPSHP